MSRCGIGPFLKKEVIHLYYHPKQADFAFLTRVVYAPAKEAYIPCVKERDYELA